jgi:serine/threonine-protein kinase
MSDDAIPDRTKLPIEILDAIDRICDRFEAAWEQEEELPRVEDYLGELDPAYRPALLRDLLAAEIDARCRRGERPDPREYHDRFPGDSAVVADAFTTMPDRPAATPPGDAARPDTGRDLLFGLIALQNGLIDQDHLVAAFRAWALEKARPLAEHLVARGDLDGEQRAAIEALVGLHLKKHGSDPVKSLASISAGRSTRESLARIADPEIDATLAQVGTGSRLTEPGGEELDSTATYIVGSTTSDGQRFRVLRPHAKGGLGAVFVALDHELHREVALKQILERHADDPVIRSRFLVEAEITGGLEHPGIVPVYGLGTYADGRPYYAMRFIRGDSLKDAVGRFHADLALKHNPGQRLLELRKLLRRFLDVCNAIDYAHSRGVLHRDLKPGNVIVGKHGETLVVDWGLAKVLGRSENGTDPEEKPLNLPSASRSAQTLPGSPIGTPAFMSLEQSCGDLDRLGPRSDVYSLGATLYYLLTNKAPFEGDDVGSMLRDAQEQRFRSPRQLDATVDRSLEAICLKAMALRPEDRYGSARALVDDVERWMADEPVTARREPVTVRLGRWARRHRTLVTGAAVLLLATTVALTVGAFLLSRANARTERRRREAERNYALARDAVKRFRDAITDEAELRNNPALQGLRKRLLKEPLAFFRSLRERLQAERDPRTESLAQLAEASFDLGYLTWEIGDMQDALIAVAESLAIRERLADANPSVSAFQSDLANSHSIVGSLLSETGKPAEALKFYKAALAIRTKLADANPSVSAFQRNLAASHYKIGLLLSANGKPAEALKSYEAALAIRTKLADANPSVIKFQSELASSHNRIGNLLSATGKPADALESHEEALAIEAKLADANPSVSAIQSGLAASHYNIGNLLGATGKPAKALKSHEAALAIEAKLADANPSVSAFQRNLALSHHSIGLLLSDTGKPAEALKSCEAALAIRTKLADANPSVSQFQSDLAASHINIGVLLSDAGKPAEALKSYRAALEIQTKLADANPAVSEYQSNLATSHNNIGATLKETGKPASALKSFEAALAIRAKLADADPSVSAFQSELAASHNNIGVLLSENGKPANALRSYESALAIQMKLADANPSVSAFQSDLATSHINIGNLLSVTGKPADALKSYEEALAILAKLADANPSVSAFQSDLARSHYNIGVLLRDTSRQAEALKSHRAALAIRTKLAGASPSVIEVQSDLATSHNQIGILLRATGKPANALMSYEAALAIQAKLAHANPSVSAIQSELAASHNNIGNLLSDTGRPADALKSYEASLAILTKLAHASPSVSQFQLHLAQSHNNIGNLLRRTGKLADALKSYEEALAVQWNLVREQPESPDFASGLGATLNNLALIDMNAKRFAAARDKLRQAVESQRRALASNPAHPTYRQAMTRHLNNLIKTTRALGDAKGRVEAERQLVELRETDPAMAAFDARLRAAVKGEQRPKDAGERLQFAQRAYELARHAAAARLWQEALEADPRLGDDRQAQHRYNAACAAALAGCGQGKDDSPPSDHQKTKLRQQALDWLTAEVGAWAKLLDTASKEQRGGIVKTLEHWQQDLDLAGIHDDAELAKLSATERVAFRKLWADVDSLLKKASRP